MFEVITSLIGKKERRDGIAWGVEGPAGTTAQCIDHIAVLGLFKRRVDADWTMSCFPASSRITSQVSNFPSNLDHFSPLAVPLPVCLNLHLQLHLHPSFSNAWLSHDRP